MGAQGKGVILSSLSIIHRRISSWNCCIGKGSLYIAYTVAQLQMGVLVFFSIIDRAQRGSIGIRTEQVHILVYFKSCDLILHNFILS